MHKNARTEKMTIVSTDPIMGLNSSDQVKYELDTYIYVHTYIYIYIRKDVYEHPQFKLG